MVASIASSNSNKPTMAAKVPVEPEKANPCCAAWQKKYLKSEKLRNHLREAVNILQQGTEEVQAQNSNLKKEYEELRVLADIEKDEKVKEYAARVSLENKVSELKSEILSLKQQREGADSQDKNEVKLLKGHVSDREQEISRLKELIEREKKRAESESKKAEVEKKKAAEAQKSMKIEKKKADEERKRANIEGEKAENYRLQLEVLEKDSAKAKSDSEGEKEISCLKELIETEKKRAESESKKAEAEKKKAAEAQKSMKIEKKKADEERKRANIEGEKAENYRIQLEVLEKGSAKAKSHSEGEKEIGCLKELIEREKKRAESESKKAEAEKKKAAEALKIMKIEKSKADEERKHANIEGEKAENYRLRLEVLQIEADEAKSNLDSETLKLEVASKKLEAEKLKVVKERECANSEMVKAEEQRKLAEANRKKTIEEKSRAESLSLQLVESRKRVDELQKELNELRCSKELHADPGGQPDCNRIAFASEEISNFDEANKRYEVEKQKVVKEKKRPDSETVRTQKQKQLAEVNWKRAMEEKSRADYLSRQLEEAKKKIEELSTRNLIEASAVQQLAKGMSDESAKVKLLKKQLKFEKMQRKHAKEVVKVKLERNRNSILQQEFGRLKLDFDQISQRMDMLNNSFSYNAEGIDDHEKTWNIMKKQRLSNKNHQGLESLQMNLQSGTDFLKSGFPVLDESDPFREAMQHTGPYPPLSGGNCTGSISASFSDGQLVGSQDRGAFSVTVPTKLVEENVQPTISNLSTEVIKRKCNETIAVVAENTVKSPVRTDGIGQVNEHSRKRKRIIDAVESIENLYCEGKKFHQQVDEKLSDLHCLLSKKIKKPVEERLHEKRKAACEGKLVLASCVVRNEQKKADRFKNECTNVCRQVPKIAGELIGTAQASREGISDLDTSDIASFDEVTDGNYLKLLELDNAADEECYRMAMEMPLSPTLPEIEVLDVETSIANKINPLIKEIICDRFSNKNGGHGDCCDTQDLNGNGSGNSAAMGKPWDIQVQDAGAEVVSNAPTLKSKAMFPFGSDGAADDNILKYHVVFSNTEDSSSISRICNASRTCIAQCSLAIHTEWMVRDILFAVKSEEKLLPKEKVCVFFSLLLLNFSVASSSKFGSMYWESNPCLDSFARHMCSVMSDGDGRRIFSEFGCLDESLGLIEDFIIHGRVFDCKMVGCHSSSFLLEDISPRPSSADELVAGSIVLASLCAAFDHIGFICETSYTILQIRRLDRSLVLKVLHVFAYVGGEKFFNFSNYNLVTVMKSIVTFLEGIRSSNSAGSCITSVSNSGTEFCPCVKCPFSEDAVSVDTATSLLLEKLQSDPFLGPMSQDVVQSVNSNTNITLCNLCDLLSLVELVASNMSWTWTSVEVVPQLMKILESCNAENVIAGIVVLLGQLGRLGVDSVGYEDKGVEFLRHELSAFLCRDIGTSAGLPTQIATVTSMLGLMSFDFKTIIQSNVNLSVISSQSDAAQVIRKWFSLLPKKQQEPSFSLLQAASVDKN
ncbi:centromere-associated protein E isoform X2 [Rosa chinensis]|uniref:centromere-associated protein E isoform X2 n=1 Tax=Rosa chinensis TaxID=74649 RepID=UPI000D097892|nr:centromere-associated protein E isoform X2 [Rosa chinensis]